MSGSAESVRAGAGFHLVYCPMRGDIAAYVRTPVDLSPVSVSIFMAMLVAIALAAPMLLRELNVPPTYFDTAWKEGVLTLAIVGAAWALHGVALATYRLVRIRRCPIAAAELVLTADESGVTVTSGGQTRHHDWAEFGAVVEAPDHVFLCLTPLKAIIVPARAFARSEDKHAFAQYAREACRRADAPESAYPMNGHADPARGR
jgi:hypothetical protein